VSEASELADLLPHAGRMLLLRGVLEHDGVATACEARPTPESWLADGTGGVPAWLALEYMAQCVAAHESLVGREAGARAGGGLLVGADALELRVERIPCDRTLRVSTRRVKGRAGIGVVQHTCRVEDDSGATLATGTLTVALGAGARRSAP